LGPGQANWQPESSFINTLPQNARSFKYHHFPGPQDKILFGLGVAASSGIFASDTKLTETTDQDIFISGKGVFDDIQNAFHGVARFLFTEPDLKIYVVDHLFFGQGHGRNSFLLPESGSEPANSYATIIIHLKITVKVFFGYDRDLSAASRRGPSRFLSIQSVEKG
jgi:hypothetical protein